MLWVSQAKNHYNNTSFDSSESCSYNQRLNYNKIRIFSCIDSTQLTGLCRVYPSLSTCKLHEDALKNKKILLS